MMNLDFLSEVKLAKTEVKTRATSIDTVPATGAALRLFKDGRIFPSAQFVEDWSLEYVSKGEAVGNGLDIIDTDHFTSYPKTAPRIAMVALASKDLPKVDLFGSVGYNEDNTPKTSVLTQGSKTTGAALITMLEEVYGVQLFANDERFVDLVVSTEHGLTTPNGIYQLPTKVARGDKKGQLDYKRRTNTELWALTLLEEIVTDEASAMTDHGVSSEATIETDTDAFTSTEGHALQEEETEDTTEDLSQTV